MCNSTDHLERVGAFVLVPLYLFAFLGFLLSSHGNPETFQGVCEYGYHLIPFLVSQFDCCFQSLLSFFKSDFILSAQETADISFLELFIFFFPATLYAFSKMSVNGFNFYGTEEYKLTPIDINAQIGSARHL